MSLLANVENLTQHSDKELILAIRKSSSKKVRSLYFTELYNRYCQRIWFYCRKVFGDGTFAEDIFQDTFERFYKTVLGDSQIENVQGLLLKIARNLSLNHKRDNKAIFSEIEDFHVPIIDNSYESKEIALIVERALELLSDEYKEAFILQVYEGLSYNEIGEIMEIPLSTVRNRVVRAKMKLRDILLPYFEEKV